LFPKFLLVACLGFFSKMTLKTELRRGTLAAVCRMRRRQAMYRNLSKTLVASLLLSSFLLLSGCMLLLGGAGGYFIAKGEEGGGGAEAKSKTSSQANKGAAY
jgi:hypothetical protein